MELITQRYSDGGDSTLGLLFIDGQFNGYTLEDEHRDVKVADETRIPAGRYEIKFREAAASKMNQRYQSKYPWFTWHLWLPFWAWLPWRALPESSVSVVWWSMIWGDIVRPKPAW
jgi:hypothetical protein